MNAFDPAAPECLAALADTGRFERAAPRLTITQLAVSQRMRTLETRLGRPRVAHSRPPRLTEPGKQLLRYACQLQPKVFIDVLLHWHRGKLRGDDSPQR